MSHTDIAHDRDVALINDLRDHAAENSLLEFKRDNENAKVIGKLCSALANSARIEQQDFAYLLWGVDDASHDVVGTTFDPNTKLVGNQVFQLWLSQRLKPGLAFSFRVVEHPDGRVVLLEIPAAASAPVSFDDIAYVRVGSATPKLTDHQGHFQKLMDNLRPFSWEKGLAKAFIDDNAVLRLLDYPAYFTLTGQNLPDNKAGIIERLASEQLIQQDVGGRWSITHLGAILFAHNLDEFEAPLARKAVRFIAYAGKNRAATVTHRQDGKKGYATGFAGLVGYINNMLPKNEHIGEAFREAQPLFPEIAIRELIANAVIHQDMTITGAGPQIELFEDRIEITNPGEPLVQADRMIDLPPRSRNEALAALMRRMNLCEEQGSGLDKVIVSVEVYQLPPPKFLADTQSMQVTLYAPRSFADMTVDERIRACYQHAVIKYLSGGEKMKNASLCERLGIESKNAAQASAVLKSALNSNQIKIADPDHPRAGYWPWWA